MNNFVWQVEPFSEQHKELWDEFVHKESLNGTFLHTRKFLNYHKPGKFEDTSLMVYKKNKLVAVCPACRITDGRENIFYSHFGSTFGGIIFGREIYCAKEMMELVAEVEKYIGTRGFNKIVMKLVPDIYCKTSMSLFEYVLNYQGYSNYVELNSYVDLECDDTMIWQKIDRNKKRNIHKCEEQELWFHKLDSDDELGQFWQLLKINLGKHGLKPIHSLEDILEFHRYRLKDETIFYGVGLGREILAAGMMFFFDKVNILHAQNLSYDPFAERNYSPITYLYYKIIMEAKKEGYSKITWGVSTEDHGKRLNMGLIRNKESYGSEYFLNATYYKSF